MLDIMIILLFFLIKNYSATATVVSVPRDIELPKSESETNNTTGIHLLVSPKAIWVDDKQVFNYETQQQMLQAEDRRILPLYDELVKKKETMEQIEKSAAGSGKAAHFEGNVNLVVDKSIRYFYLKRILHTCAEAGFIKYKMVVKEKFNKME